MPISVPVPDKTAGDVFTETMWDQYIRDNINKLLNLGHRVLTLAQFTALTGVEDGDEVYLEVDGTNGVIWHLRYVAAEVTYKWRFLGGPALFSEVATSESTSSTTYVALTTAGPSVTLPRSGDYDVQVGSELGSNGRHSYDIGATAAVDADSVAMLSGGAGHSFRERRKTGLTPVALTSKYRTPGGTPSFSQRRIGVRPIRIRHDA